MLGVVCVYMAACVIVEENNFSDAYTVVIYYPF
jgi:hypothetical protein